LLVVCALADPPHAVPAQMRLKDGTVYDLREPPHMAGGRVVSTTREGKVYSLAERDVEEIRLIGPTPVPRAVLNPLDSRQLGAIARQERRKKGTHTLNAPAVPPLPKKTAAS